MLEVRPYSPRDTLFRRLAGRDVLPSPEAVARAADILQALRREENDAILDMSRIAPEAIDAARKAVPEQFLTALSLARVNCRKFHEYQKRWSYLHDEDGVRIALQVRPLKRVGICCRSASALLAFAVPAQVAGVGEIAVCAPPSADGTVDPHILATAKILGIDEIYALDGAMGVGALALGRGSVPGVDKVVGPAGPEADAAKNLLHGRIGSDGAADWAELAVIADGGANAKFIAADLLARAEGRDRGLFVLLTSDRLLAEAVRIELDLLAERLEAPAAVTETVCRHGGLFVFPNLDEAVDAANLLAPGALTLATRDNAALVSNVENAGAVFLGDWSPDAAADFAGLNPYFHGGGGVRFASGLGVNDFVKEMAVVEYGPERLLLTGRHIVALRRAEPGQAEIQAVNERLTLLRQ